MAFLGSGRFGVRDSKNPGGPALLSTPGEWDGFTACVASGEFRRSPNHEHQSWRERRSDRRGLAQGR